MNRQPSARLTFQTARIGDGGPGTSYSSVGFAEACKRHGRPFGPFEAKRILPYDGALMHESENISPLEMPVSRSWERFTDQQLFDIYGARQEPGAPRPETEDDRLDRLAQEMDR